MQSWTRPTRAEVEQARRLLIDNQQTRHFFARLQNPTWIAVLHELDGFATPPSLKVDSKRNTVSFPPWPESQYLARVAAGAPADAVSAALSIPGTTNISVLEDLIAVALAVDASLAARLVPRLLKDYKSPYAPHRSGELLAKLAQHLAAGGRVDDSLKVTRAVLALQSPPDDRGGESTYLPPDRHSRIEAWSYHRILSTYIVPTASVIGVELVGRLASILRDVVERESLRFGHRKGLGDNSDHWLESVESIEPDRRTDHALVRAILDASRLIIASRPEALSEIVSELTHHRRSVFARMVLVLLADDPGAHSDLATKFLLDRSLFDQLEVRREYRALLEARVSSLRSTDQERLLHWIDEGPPIETWKESYRLIAETDMPPDVLAVRVAQWEFDALFPLRTHLVGSWRARFEKLQATHGSIPSYLMSREGHHAGWGGVRSPRTADELRALTDDEIAELLRTWQSSEERDKPSRSGLAEELGIAVRADPERFSRMALSFEGLDPVYVRAVFDALQSVLASGARVVWGPTLALALWVTDEPRRLAPGDGDNNDIGSEWRSTRMSIAWLLRDALQRRESIESSHRESVWRVIAVLLVDPDPRSDRNDAGFSEHSENSIGEASNRALNCVRGVAMDAAIEYALWVRSRTPAPRPSSDASDVPEVLAALSEHLDRSVEQSLAVHSVYGRFLPWLNLLDRRWFDSFKARIFPRDAGEEQYWRVAWSTYLTMCRPYDDTFLVVRSEYERAVSLLGTWRDSNASDRVDESLGEHIVMFYLRGKLALDDSLVRTFWSLASSDVRRHTIWWMGRLLAKGENTVEIPSDVTSRMRLLWEMRRSQAEAATNRADHVGEMEAFGGWFVQGVLPDEWTVPELVRSSDLARNIDLPNEVIERLSGLASEFPLEAIRTLEFVAEGDEWNLLGRSAAVTKLVRESFAREPGVTSDVAHRLARDRGWLELLSIVDKTRSDS